jgi:hypothetical protein
MDLIVGFAMIAAGMSWVLSSGWPLISAGVIIMAFAVASASQY